MNADAWRPMGLAVHLGVLLIVAAPCYSSAEMSSAGSERVTGERLTLSDPLREYAAVGRDEARREGSGWGRTSDDLDPPPWIRPPEARVASGSTRLLSVALEIPAAALGTVVGYGVAGGVAMLYLHEGGSVRGAGGVGLVGLGAIPAGGAASGAYLAATDVGAYEPNFVANLIGSMVGVAAVFTWMYSRDDFPPPVAVLVAAPTLGAVAGGEVWSLLNGSESKNSAKPVTRE